MKYILSLIISGALVVSGFGQTRNVLVGTNNAVVQPTNFWSADAPNARSGLGLGTAATNPASAFQPSSLVLSNLASSNAINLTNLRATNFVGTLSLSQGGTGSTNAADARAALGLGTASTNPASAFQPSSSVLSNLASGSGLNITNIAASNIVGTLSVVQGGTGATNASDARQNLGSTTVGDAVFTATNAAVARTALSLGTAATSATTDFQPANANLTNLSTNNGASLTGIPISGVSNLQSSLDAKLATNGNASGLSNITAANITGTVALASNITGTAALATNVTGIVALANGGTAGTNASSARSSLGATTVGANLFTLANPDDTRFIRLNANNTVSTLSAADMRTALSVGTNLGTVTSVGLTVPSFLSVSTPTITSSGTFAITLGNQTSRHAFIAPNGGGIPAFRALESDDLPSLAISKITGLQTALDGKLSTSGTAALATNVTGVVALANGGTGGTNAASARSGLGATTVGENIFTIPNPSAVRFLRLNADNTVSALSDLDFRTALSLGTAATNAASAFQPADSDLNALAANNGGSLTNLTAANIVGTVALASNITGTAPLATNVTGIVALANGGTGATNAATARTNLGLGWSALTNTDATNFRNAIGLGVTNVVRFESIQLYQDGETTNSITYGTDQLFFNQNGVEFFSLDGSAGGTIVFRRPILFSGTNAAANAAVSRTNLGLPWGGLTNTNAVGFRNALEIGTTNTLTIAGITAQNITVTAGGGITLQSVITNAASFRTNIGLPWSGLTNTNSSTFQASLFGSNTNPVLVNTNGEVVSPTNFWQVAPISTTVQYQTNVTGTSTNAATNSRNLFLFSLAPSVSGITNTVTLPTNPATTFEGDRATITHLANSTNAVTAIRQLGATNNLITLNQLDETVLLIYRSGAWRLADNISYIEPIYFSGTNAAANAAASRTNLGLGAMNDVSFSDIQINESGEDPVFVKNESGFLQFIVNTNIAFSFSDSIGTFNFPVEFNNTTNAAITRTNLGLPLAALTNTSNTNFQAAVFTTNAAPTNSANVNGIGFNTAVAWMEVTVSTNGTNHSFRIPLFR